MNHTLLTDTLLSKARQLSFRYQRDLYQLLDNINNLIHSLEQEQLKHSLLNQPLLKELYLVKGLLHEEAKQARLTYDCIGCGTSAKTVVMDSGKAI